MIDRALNHSRGRNIQAELLIPLYLRNCGFIKSYSLLHLWGSVLVQTRPQSGRHVVSSANHADSFYLIWGRLLLGKFSVNFLRDFHDTLSLNFSWFVIDFNVIDLKLFIFDFLNFNIINIDVSIWLYKATLGTWFSPGSSTVYGALGLIGLLGRLRLNDALSSPIRCKHLNLWERPVKLRVSRLLGGRVLIPQEYQRRGHLSGFLDGGSWAKCSANSVLGSWRAEGGGSSVRFGQLRSRQDSLRFVEGIGIVCFPRGGHTSGVILYFLGCSLSLEGKSGSTSSQCSCTPCCPISVKVIRGAIWEVCILLLELCKLLFVQLWGNVVVSLRVFDKLRWNHVSNQTRDWLFSMGLWYNLFFWYSSSLDVALYIIDVLCLEVESAVRRWCCDFLRLWLVWGIHYTKS